MAANTNPRFTKNGVIGSVTVTAANTKSDGSGTIATDTFLVVTGNSSNGSFIEKLRWMATATAASTATAQTSARVYVSTQTSGATTSANTFLVGEITLTAQTADSITVAVQPFDFLCGFTLPASNTILVQNGTAPNASTAWRCTAIGGDY